jgi:hypothetical protein
MLKISGRDPQGAWRQDELIGGKPPVVKLTLMVFQMNDSGTFQEGHWYI